MAKKTLDDLLEKFDEMVEVDEDAPKPEPKKDPKDCKYQITANVIRADLLQDPETATQTLGADTEEDVKSILQQLNGYKSSLGDIDIRITDQNGAVYNPWDFGLPKPSTYQHRIAQKVGKVIEGEGYRDVYEDLLEFMCVKPWKDWDIIEALDEVFDEDDGPDIPETSAFNRDLAVAIDLVNQTKGTSREAFENLLELMLTKRWKSWDITEALDEVFGEWEPNVATFDVAVYNTSDEQVQKALDSQVTKEEFLEALEKGDFKNERIGE